MTIKIGDKLPNGTLFEMNGRSETRGGGGFG